MTTQNDLDRVWALNGVSTDPDKTNYELGWVSEIPTFQEFNYVLKNNSTNILSLAEGGTWSWQADITYSLGAIVRYSDGLTYFCIENTSLNNLPTDNQYWSLAPKFGVSDEAQVVDVQGLYLRFINTRTTTGWEGSDLTIANLNAVIQLSTSSSALDNYLLHNVNGEIGVTNVGNTYSPDNRSIAYSQPNTHRLFHEGHPPVQSEVSGTIPENPNNTTLYARRGTNWVAVTSNQVSATPPEPVTGTGTGWYNLEDGQYYLDINDGDSSQWVPANPPLIPSNVWTSTNLNITEIDGIGSVQLMKNTSGGNINYNEVVAGSSLSKVYSASNVFVSNSSPVGSWRNLLDTAMVNNVIAHFVRVA